MGGEIHDIRWIHIYRRLAIHKEDPLCIENLSAQQEHCQQQLVCLSTMSSEIRPTYYIVLEPDPLKRRVW